VPSTSTQSEFERRRGHLSDPHVRDLAWLLDSPDLLDPDAPQWRGKIATLFDHQGADIDNWLVELDRAPQELHGLIESHGFARLGRYSELLMAHFFRRQNILFAHGLQVRAGKSETIGEFDFLLLRAAGSSPPSLLHWEFATKFYLQEASGSGCGVDFLVGPNIVDTLGAKMRKILDRQLSLSSHAAAQMHLPQAVASAQALVKGWLFYPRTEPGSHAAATTGPSNSGVAGDHCRGYWCELAEAGNLSGECYRILPRLSWLAPARVPRDACIDKADLIEALREHFASDSLPVMVATMERKGEMALEIERGFIVANDWRMRASAFISGI